jgi:hypothetical protein
MSSFNSTIGIATNASDTSPCTAERRTRVRHASRSTTISTSALPIALRPWDSSAGQGCAESSSMAMRLSSRSNGNSHTHATTLARPMPSATLRRRSRPRLGTAPAERLRAWSIEITIERYVGKSTVRGFA